MLLVLNCLVNMHTARAKKKKKTRCRQRFFFFLSFKRQLKSLKNTNHMFWQKKTSPIQPAFKIFDEYPNVATRALASNALAAVPPSTLGHGDDNGEVARVSHVLLGRPP